MEFNSILCFDRLYTLFVSLFNEMHESFDHLLYVLSVLTVECNEQNEDTFGAILVLCCKKIPILMIALITHLWFIALLP